jgi:metallo-beta-lactamase class B
VKAAELPKAIIRIFQKRLADFLAGGHPMNAYELRKIMYGMNVIGILLALAAGTARAQTPEQLENWNRPVAPFRIIGNVYYVGASDVTSFLIVTPAGDILLDGGLAQTAPQIEANIETLGFKLNEVKILLNSHAHFDHAAGLAELKKNTGARLVGMEGDAGQLARGGRADFFFGDTALFPPVQPDRVIHDGDTVSLGGTTLTAELTPGHTRGCTTWTMTTNEAGKDREVVFLCSATVLDGYELIDRPNHPASYPGIAADYEKAFRVWKSLPCDVFLASHGQFFNLTEKREALASGAKENPFIDPKGYEAYVSSKEADFRTELERQQSEASKPGFAAQAAAHPTAAEVLEFEQQWLDALRRGDIPALERILAPDWMDHSARGQVVMREDFFSSGGESGSPGMPRRTVVSQHFENTRVRFYGDLAIATGAVITEYARVKPEEASRQTVIFTDVLAWRDGRWQAVSSQETLAAGSAH